MKVELSIRGATIYAVISGGGRKLDVLLTPGMTYAESLRKSGLEHLAASLRSADLASLMLNAASALENPEQTEESAKNTRGAA